MLIEHRYDVVIVGAGGAGMRAAVEAGPRVRTAVLTKLYPTRSHTGAAQGGMCAALANVEEDNWEWHTFDTVKGGDYLADQDAVEIMCSEASQDIIELEHMGVIFFRDEQCKPGTRAFGVASKARTYFVCDITGQSLLYTLYDQILNAGVKVYEEWFSTALYTVDGQCHGTVALDMMTGELHLLRAGAVIMASGGMGRVYEPSTNALICTAYGIALAYPPGAPPMLTQTVHYHPTTLKGTGFLMTEAARGEGAYLLNAAGERFMQRYAPKMMELASRDVVSRSETIEIAEGRGVDGCVFLDLRHLGRDLIMHKLPQIHEIALDFLGIDMVTDPVPVRPGMHYIMGGVKTDVNGATAMPGLYAAGECACVSVHGGNRLGANSLLDTLVFGRRSGVASSQYVKASGKLDTGEEFLAAEQARIQALLDRPYAGETHARVRLELGTMMDEHVGVYRDEAGLNTALGKLHDLKGRYELVAVGDKSRVFNQALTFVLELGYMLDCAEATVLSALTRKESRGAQSRTDYPTRNDAEWLRHVVVHRPSGQAPTIDFAPVSITKWPPQERTY